MESTPPDTASTTRACGVNASRTARSMGLAWVLVTGATYPPSPLRRTARTGRRRQGPLYYPAFDHFLRSHRLETHGPLGTLWVGIGLGCFYIALIWLNTLLGFFLTPLFIIPATWLMDKVGVKRPAQQA